MLQIFCWFGDAPQPTRTYLTWPRQKPRVSGRYCPPPPASAWPYKYQENARFECQSTGNIALSSAFREEPESAEVFCVLIRSGGSIYLPKIWKYLAKHTSPRFSCHSSKQSKQTNQTTQAALCYVKRGRENTARPCTSARHLFISGQGRSPSARPAGHHTSPSQPHHHCALSSTAKPAPRPPTCGCSTGPRTSRPRAAPQRSEPSAAGEVTQLRRAPGLSLRATRQRAKQRTAKGAACLC